MPFQPYERSSPFFLPRSRNSTQVNSATFLRVRYAIRSTDGQRMGLPDLALSLSPTDIVDLDSSTPKKVRVIWSYCVLGAEVLAPSHRPPLCGKSRVSE
eukprot:798800-Rhodomonas_salina.1